MKFEIIKDRRELDIPEQPIITYQLVGDFGEDRTKTLLDCESLTEIYVAIDEIRVGELDRPLLDLTKEELPNLKGVSIEVTLTSSSDNFRIYTNGGESEAYAELVAFKVVED